jgi:RNA polymerase sigma-70 factor (ECF subfamily)
MPNSNNSNIIAFTHIANGNKLAFNTLFGEYYEELCEFAFRIIGSKELAEEIVADVFAHIWIKREELNITISLKAYLYKSTKNMTISYIRKKKNNTIPLDDILPFHESIAENPESNILKKERIVAYEKILSIIPNKSRIIFKMHRIDSLKYREIADILNISQKTVEKHMGKALKILRNYNAESVIGVITFLLFL